MEAQAFPIAPKFTGNRPRPFRTWWVLKRRRTKPPPKLLRLATTRQEIESQLHRTQKEFAGGRVLSPVDGIVATHPARAGETILAGSSIAEIFQAGEVYVDWYIPDFRLVDPQPGYRVVVGLGRIRALGTIGEILPISDTFEGRRSTILREPQRGQIARIRLDPGVPSPTLNATVQVYMYYTDLAGSIAEAFVRFFDLDEGR